jgi:hypothetical protein
LGPPLEVLAAAAAAAREAEANARTAAQRAADQLARDAEIEATRQSAWVLYLTDLSDPERYKRLVAKSLSPTWIANNTPPSGWPEGDGPEMHEYFSVAPPGEPEDDGVVPPLVIRARRIIGELYQTPPDVVAQAKAAVAPER